MVIQKTRLHYYCNLFWVCHYIDCTNTILDYVTVNGTVVPQCHFNFAQSLNSSSSTVHLKYAGQRFLQTYLAVLCVLTTERPVTTSGKHILATSEGR